MSERRLCIYSTAKCPRCEKTKTLLRKWRIEYREVLVDENRAGLMEMARIAPGVRSVPQIVIDGRWIGGLSELTELHMEGRLADLVSEEP